MRSVLQKYNFIINFHLIRMSMVWSFAFRFLYIVLFWLPFSLGTLKVSRLITDFIKMFYTRYKETFVSFYHVRFVISSLRLLSLFCEAFALEKAMKMESTISTRRSQYICKNDKFEQKQMAGTCVVHTQFENNGKESEKKKYFKAFTTLYRDTMYTLWIIMVAGWRLASVIYLLFLQNTCCMPALIRGKWMKQPEKI